MSAGHVSSSAPDPWRNSKDNSRSTTLAAERFSAVFWTIVLLVVLALLVLLLWPRTPGKAFLVSWAMRYDEPGRVTPDNPFWESEGDPLRATEGNKYVQYDHWSRIDVSTAHPSGLAIAERLADIDVETRDSFSLYLQADGIAREESVYLFYEDFEPGAKPWHKEDAVFRVASLLEQFKSCEANAKILLLDTGRIDYDPRLGVLENGLTRAVEREVRKVKDPHLWVLMSHSDHQRTGGLLSQYPTIFARSVAEAMAGEAAKRPCGDDKEGEITLKEFYYYVWNRTNSYFPDATEYAQIPVLMRGGYGAYWPGERNGSEEELTKLEDELEKQILVNVSRTEESPPEEEGEGQESDTEPQQGSEAESGSDDGKPKSDPLAETQSSSASESKEEEATPPDGKDAEAKKPSESPKTDAGPDDNKSPAGKSDKPAASDQHDSAEEPGEDDGEAEESTPADRAAETRWMTCWKKMWAERDRLEDPDSAVWGPVDFAPHVWRILNAKLLGFEQKIRFRNDMLADPSLESLCDDIDRVTGDLTQLSAHLRHQTSIPSFRSHQDRYFRDLVELAKRYEDASHLIQKPGYDATSLETIRRAIRHHNLAAFLIPDYLRWHASSRRSVGYRTDDYSRRGDKLHAFMDALAELRGELKRRDGERLTEPLEGYLNAEVAELKKAREALDSLLSRDVDDVKDAVQGRGPWAECRSSDLLSSPLLRGELRLQLMTVHTAEATDVAPLTRCADPKRDDANLSIWECLADLVDLEIRAIELFDSDTSKRVRGIQDGHELLVDRWNRGGRQERPQVIEDFWQHYATVGNELGDFYANLPAIARRPAGAEENNCWALRLVDARDTGRVKNEEVPDLALEHKIIPRPPKPVLKFAEDGGAILQLSDKPSACSTRFEAQRLKDAQFSVVCDPKYLGVSYDGMPLTSGTWQELSLATTDGGIPSLDLSISARPPRDRVEAFPNKLTIRLRASSLNDESVLTAEHVVNCELLPPDQVDVLITRIARNGERIREQPRGSSEDVLLARCYPNRDTEFSWQLSNKSGDKKKVRLELVQVPEIENGRWPPGQLGFDGAIDEKVFEEVFENGEHDGTLSSDVHVIATGEMELPASDEWVPLSFVGEPGGEDGPDEAKVEKKPPKPLPEEGADVTHGMALLITDLGSSGIRWTKWIELGVRHPRTYLEPLDRDGNPPKFVDDRIRVPIRLKPDTDDMPPFSEDNPIKVIWKARDGDRNLDVKTDGSLTPLEGRGTTEEIYEIVELDVDGYPRAFAIAIEPRASGELIEWWKTITRAGIQFRAIEAHYEESEPKAVFLKQSLSSVAFARESCTRLLIRLAVDVPYTTTFGRNNGDDDGIGLLMDGRSLGTFYSDRAVETRLITVNEGGMKLHAKITDHSVEITSMPTRRMEIEARFRTSDSTTISDSITIYLDNEPPTLEFVDAEPPPEEVIVGEKVRAVVALNDEGGVRTVEWGVAQESPEFEAVGKSQSKKHDGYVAQVELAVPADTADLKADSKCWLVIRATDRAGNTSDLASAPIQVVAAVMDAKPQKGVIKGEIRYKLGNERQISGPQWRLTIAGPDMPETRFMHNVDDTFRDGKFKFEDLSPGEYHLRAFTDGSIDGYAYTSESVRAEPKPSHEPGIVIIAK